MRLENLDLGEKGDLYVVIDSRGSCAVREFIDSLNLAARKKITKLFNIFLARGFIRNEHSFVNEDDGIWAFKDVSIKVRIYCFFYEKQSKRTFILTHGAIKKEDKLNPSDKAKALRITKYFQEKGFPNEDLRLV
jgi:hypothetical protein